MSKLVIKLGGNALGNNGGIPEALNVIASQSKIWDQVVVVTSALSGVTDALHSIVQTAASGAQSELRHDLAVLREMHLEAAHQALGRTSDLQTLYTELDTLFFNLIDDCDVILQKRQAAPSMADRVVATGEKFITRIVAAAGRSRGLRCVAMDAERFIITDDRHANARPITSLSEKFMAQNLLPVLQRQIIPIITGYVGASEQGAVTTLGRGGSDYSATYLGALLQADEIWFFTDVDGLMSADPDIVPTAHVLATSSYREVAEMAHFGAKVMHPRAIEPLMNTHIPLRIRPLAAPEKSGTYIYYNDSPNYRIHAVTQVNAVKITGPSQSNLVEACNRLLSQRLNDDIQPTLQMELRAESMAVYIAPTSANREAFFNLVDFLRTSDANPDWQVEAVMVIAVIGALRVEDHLAVFKALIKAEITPSAFGQGPRGALVLALRPDEAERALNAIHYLILH